MHFLVYFYCTQPFYWTSTFGQNHAYCIRNFTVYILSVAPQHCHQCSQFCGNFPKLASQTWRKKEFLLSLLVSDKIIGLTTDMSFADPSVCADSMFRHLIRARRRGEVDWWPSVSGPGKSGQHHQCVYQQCRRSGQSVWDFGCSSDTASSVFFTSG